MVHVKPGGTLGREMVISSLAMKGGVNYPSKVNTEINYQNHKPTGSAAKQASSIPHPQATDETLDKGRNRSSYPYNQSSQY